MRLKALIRLRRSCSCFLKNLNGQPRLVLGLVSRIPANTRRGLGGNFLCLSKQEPARSAPV
jgi:hypothetical protein